MTLDNLIGKLLERINPDSAAIQRLLEAAQRNIKDAELIGLSNENRFDAAYKAIMQLSNAALQAAGFRTPLFLLHSGDSCNCNGAGYYVAGGVKAATVVALFSFHE